MRLSRKPWFETVAEVNGWEIVRYREGSGTTYWRAEKNDAEGYRVARSNDLPTRRSAEQFAAAA